MVYRYNQREGDKAKRKTKEIIMKNVTCEICGAEIKTNVPNFYTMFGQRACCEKCMEELSKKQAAETSKKFHGIR